MAKLMKLLQPLQSEYVDRRFDGTKEEYFRALELSSTLYIGNLSFYTTEDQIHELFSKVGPVARVIVGLDRNTKTPCGFCFVTYHTRRAAADAVRFLNGTKLDNRALRVDIDYGFEEGRQFGRGRSGGQVRDEFRTDYDADRGGYGRVVAQQLAAQQLAMWQEVQAGALLGAGMLPDAAAGGAVFFDQAQRELPGGRGDAGGDDGGAAAHDAGGGGAPGSPSGSGQQPAGGVTNPRMRGRGQDKEEEQDWEEQRVKRRRVALQEDPPPVVAAAAGHDGDDGGGSGGGADDAASDGEQQRLEDDAAAADAAEQDEDMA